MKKIGQGLQHEVFEYGSDRVIKYPRTMLSLLKDDFSKNPLLVFNFKKILRIMNNYKSLNELRSLSRAIVSRNVNLGLLGNPIFEGDKIIQDKVEVLSEVFGKGEEKDRILIDRYIESIYETWQSGFSDRVYNLLSNSGLNKNDKVVLLDFGEITFNKSDVENDIKQQKWKEASNFKKDLPKSIKGYYQEKMSKELTLQKLDTYWKSSA
ncbi:hypothetical protein KC644_00740 [Candidatus Berkelbacteria bacterium]|nr:hypothetical protein [Candidatus Berkelbacteria bacterium]